MHPTPRRSGFTLIELLIVIGVILVLVAILLPVIGMIKDRSKEAVCRNNLQQLGIAITTYRGEQRDGRPPGTLIGLFAHAATAPGNGPALDQALAGESRAKSLVCPLDSSKGADNRMGMQSWLYANQTYDLRQLHEPGSSYSYETSDKPLNAARTWFFPAQGAEHWPQDTWADGKAYELKHGNDGGPYRPEFFPIVRCWHHYSWPVHSYKKKILNVAWDGSVFWCAPSGGDSPQSPERWEALAK